jgi:cell division septation protein DedD
MREQNQTDGRKAFMALALLILGGLIFAAGVMIGQRLVQCPEPTVADPLKQLDKISARPQIDSRALSFPETLSGPRPKPIHRPDATPKASNGENSAEENLRSAPTDQKDKVSPSTAAGRYCMQVASYHERTQAQTLVDRLSKRGYLEVRVVEGTTSEKGVVFRVRVGHFTSREDAERQKEKIAAEENLSVLIVTEE